MDGASSTTRCRSRADPRAPALALLLLLLLPAATNAQSTVPDPRTFSELDRYVREAPAAASASLLHLARYLNAKAHTEAEKARALYVWITHNVAYDVVAYRSGQLRSTNLDADEILQRRETICDGYSRLFEDLGNLMGLIVERVEGFANLGQRSAYGDGAPNHAWNAVRIDGRWRLIDATWGAGYVDGRTGRFVRRFDEGYFLAAPERLVSTHYPSDPKWQLLEPPIPIRIYLQQLKNNSSPFAPAK